VKECFISRSSILDIEFEVITCQEIILCIYSLSSFVPVEITLNKTTNTNINKENRGATSSSFRGGQFLWNFIRWRRRAYSAMVQLFRKRSHIIIKSFARRHEVHSIQTHTFCTTLVNKNRAFYKSVGGWITSVKRNFWLHAIYASTEQHSTYKMRKKNWWLGLRVWCLGKCVGLGFMLQLQKEK